VNEINQQLLLSSKKRYQEPCLRIYGDIRKITGVSSNMGPVADAMLGGTKTL
jgi:hypothetical protein